MAKKILIIHLMSLGDCLMVTAVARQIKHDYPGCRLTWAISQNCRQIIENNPFIDDIWEVQHEKSESPFADVWYKVKKEAEERKQAGEFDEIISTQIFPDNIYNFDGTTRSSTFRGYSGKISVPVTPIISLFDYEVECVKYFAVKYQLEKYRHVILCECAPSSGQSFLTPELILEIASKIAEANQDIIFIISTHTKLETNNKQIIDASVLSFRENAELSKYCTLLVGCSSGITWLLTSDWAKKIPTIQFLTNTLIPFQFASVRYDFKYWGLPHDHIIESTVSNVSSMQTIIQACIKDFTTAKKYEENLYPDLKILENFFKHFFKPGKIFKNFAVARNFVNRNKVPWWRYGYIAVLIAKKVFFTAMRKIKNFHLSTK